MLLVTHSFYAFYWLLDNLGLMASFNLINVSNYQLEITANKVKFLGLGIACLANLRKWVRLHHTEIKLKTQLKSLKTQ